MTDRPGIYKVRLKGLRVMWAVLYGAAHSETEASLKALRMYSDEDPSIAVVKCSRIEEASFLPDSVSEGQT